ncbi:MAG TPA: ATP-binding protein [Blastococcus sp.]|nr:ATP-binding protein [Blastococcus sp.]
MTGHGTGSTWPSAYPPPASRVLTWQLRDVAELPRLREDIRRHTDAAVQPDDEASADLRDQLVLAFDEMASNALRHGGGEVHAVLRLTEDSYLIEVSDQAEDAPPSPAVGRDPSEGGLGLYLIAEMASLHGWYVREGHKHVWALLPRH